MLSTGLLPQNNILNPFAWMQFMDYVGQNKKKKKSTDTDKY